MKIFAFHHHGHSSPWDSAPPWAVELGAMLIHVIDNQEKIMATLDQVLTDVTDESNRLDSLSTLIDGLKTQLSDALSGANLPAPVQAKVDAIFAAAETNKGKIDAALNANVPAPTPA